MTFRINVNSLKNAMGTMFLLVAAFFVCSTFMSMRSVLADPIIQQDMITKTSGRPSPRANATTTNRARTTRATTARATTQPVSRTSASRASTANRAISSRSATPSRVSVSSRTTSSPRASRSNGVATRSSAGATRTVRSRNNATATRTTNNRSVRARTGATQSRVSATGSVMAGSRASSSSSYTYLSSKLYTGSYSNIIDSTTGLISADAYSNCMDSYYTCMDEICTARSDTKGRCSCAGRVNNFLELEEQLEQANEQLIQLSGQLSLLIATKGKGDDLASAFSLTEAEQVMNCVSYKESKDKEQWYKDHPTYDSTNNLVTDYTKEPEYCTKNNYGFDISNINGSGSDILSQLKAWADAKDLANEYSKDNPEKVITGTNAIKKVVNELLGSDKEETVSLDSLAQKWGYRLFEYAHNNVCGRVLDSCFNGIYEACGTPPSVTDSDGDKHNKCANGQTSNCPYNYNSYISVKVDANGSSVDKNGEVTLNERGAKGSAEQSSCFGYTTTSSVTGTRSIQNSVSSDPYSTLRGPVADARRSIMQKYLLDANAACDTYGAALKQTAQNINYQRIAAEQTLQQKRLEFRQQEDSATISDAKAAINNFNECISEIWDCYGQYAKEENWTTARIKAYCSQVSQVPHCYETMICSPLQSQLIAVIDKADDSECAFSNNYRENTCRNVVTISEILYGTGTGPVTVDGWDSLSSTALNSAGLREACLQRALGCGSKADPVGSEEDAYCLRNWNKTDKGQVATKLITLDKATDYVTSIPCTQEELSKIAYATEGLKINGKCQAITCGGDMKPDRYGTKCECPSGNSLNTDSLECVPTYKTCNVANGQGRKTWQGTSYGDCVITCDEGFELVNDSCKQKSSN